MEQPGWKPERPLKWVNNKVDEGEGGQNLPGHQSAEKDFRMDVYICSDQKGCSFLIKQNSIIPYWVIKTLKHTFTTYRKIA